MIFNVKELIVYVAHPYGADPENAAKVEDIIRDLVDKYPRYCFISPIHTFGFLYEDVDYEEGMEHCYTLLNICDEIWIYGDSQGTRLEREFAELYGIPIREMR